VIHFAGGGNMATAMIEGLEGLDTPPELVVIDPNEAARARHTAAGRSTSAHLNGVANVQRMVLAFKPQHFAGAVDALRQALASDALVVTIMAGISTQTIQRALPGCRVVRVMPNTPMSVGWGMSGVAPGDGATEADLAVAEQICGASGAVLRVREDQMDAVTAISGSGPAYFFRFCEALMDAAVARCGFTEDEARLLVSQTAQGAMAYAGAQEGFPVGRLREQVTSPGGTTQAALDAFAQGNLGALVADAVDAAVRRGEELNADAE
jgi:pyrroline-5-carboxylate reductase